jgi:hypothetical protein
MGFLWSKFGCVRTLLLVPWEVCTLSKQRGLGFIDIKLQVVSFVNWIIQCLVNDDLGSMCLLIFKITSSKHINKIREPFLINDVIEFPSEL